MPSFIKFKPSVLLLSAILSVFSLSACSDDKDEPTKPKKMSLFDTTEAADQALSIVDADGNPVANAQVLIGDAVNSPFASNMLQTDASGNFTAPAAWTNPLTVTITAAGFVRTSFLAQTPKAQKFTLRAASKNGRFEVKGQGTNISVKNGDGLIDFSVMLSPLRKRDFVSVDIDRVISPENDSITVLGQTVDLPSNISCPTQKESYILPVTLSKPVYRTYFTDDGPQKLFALKGQFPLKKVVDELRAGKEFYEIINDFTLQSGGLRDVLLKGGSTALDIPTDEMPFNQKVALKTPNYPADQVLLALILAEKDGYLIPTDMKNVPSNSLVNLTTVSGQNLWVINTLQKQKTTEPGQISSYLSPFNSTTQPQMLGLLATPQVVDAATIRLGNVQPLPELTVRSTYAVLSKVTKSQIGTANVESLEKLWEVYAPEWVSEIKLPAWPGETSVAGAKRWEVTFAGGPQMRSVDAGAPMLDSATHATRNQVDFQ